MNSPTELPITICIPTYNGAEYLEQALASLLSQIDYISSVIVSDDGSTDTTKEILQRFNHPKITKIFQNKSLGMVGNWNYLIQKVETEYLAIFHQDDVYRPNYFTEMYGAIKSTEADIAYCDVATLDADNNEYIDTKFEIKRAISIENKSMVWNSDKIIKALFKGCFINCPAVMYRKSVFSDVGLFNPDYKFVQDWEFWLRAAVKQKKITYVPGKYYSYRVHNNNATSKYKANFRKYDERAKMVKSVLQSLSHHPLYNFFRKTSDISLRNVLIWDAIEDIAAGNRSGALDKFKYGDANIKDFKRFYLRRLFGFLGKKSASAFFWAIKVLFLTKLGFHKLKRCLVKAKI